MECLCQSGWMPLPLGPRQDVDQGQEQESACLYPSARRDILDSLQMIFLRPNGLGSPDDYSEWYRHGDGRELSVGRIFLNNALVGGQTPWFWSVEFHQRRWRAEPHQGQADDLESAKAAWRKCWDSADTPIHWPPSKRQEGSHG